MRGEMVTMWHPVTSKTITSHIIIIMIITSTTIASIRRTLLL
jgi:hypothetical protein